MPVPHSVKRVVRLKKGEFGPRLMKVDPTRVAMDIRTQPGVVFVTPLNNSVAAGTVVAPYARACGSLSNGPYGVLCDAAHRRAPWGATCYTYSLMRPYRTAV